MASALVMPADAERLSAPLILRQNEGRIVVLEPITRCKKVALLDVDSNFITDRQLAHLHQQNCMLFLSLRGNNIGHFGLQPPAPDALLTLQRLRVLRLDRNQLSSMPGPWLSLPSLSVLTLDENHITGSGPSARCELPSLTALRVRANGMTSLAALGTVAMPSLATLDLDGNRLVSLSGLDGQLPGLTHLSVRANRLMMLTTPSSVDDAVDKSHTSTQTSVSTARASALSLPLLETLRVDCNSLSDITALRGCRRLVRLYSAFNALQQWPQLSELSRTLQVLDISHNRLTDVSLPSLSHLSSLVSLRMGYNRFTDAAKVAEAVGASSLPRLIELDTRGNPCCATFYTELSTTSRLPTTSFALTDSLDISRHSSIHTLLSMASGGAADGNVSVASSRHSTPGRASRGVGVSLQAPVPVDDTPLFEVQWPDRDDSPLLLPSDRGQPLIYFPGTQSQPGSGLEDETSVRAATSQLPPFEMHSPVGAGAPQSIILARAAFRGTILLHAGGQLQALDGYRVAPEEWVRVGKGPLQQQLARQHDSVPPSSSSAASVSRPANSTSQVQFGANRRASIGKASEVGERSRGRRGSWESSLRPFLGPGSEPSIQAHAYGRRHSISKQQDLDGSTMKEALQYHRSPEQGKTMRGVPLGIQSGTYRDVGDVSQPAPALEMPSHPSGLAKPILAQGHTVLQEDGMSYRAVSPPPPVHEQAVNDRHSRHQAPPQHAWSSFVPLTQSSPPDRHALSPGFAGGQEVVFVRVRAEKQEKTEDAARSGDVQEAAVVGAGHVASPPPMPQTHRPASDAPLDTSSAPSQPPLSHVRAQAVIPASLDSSVTKSAVTSHDSGDRSSLWSTSGLWELAARAGVRTLSPRPSMQASQHLPHLPARAREALDSGTKVSAANVASSDVPILPIAARPPDGVADKVEEVTTIGLEGQGREERTVKQPMVDQPPVAHFAKRTAELGKVHLGTFRDVNEARRARLAATCQRRTPGIPGHGPDPAAEAAHIVAVVAALSESALAAQHAAEEAAEAAASAALHASRAFPLDTSTAHPHVLPTRVIVKEQETQIGGISEEAQPQAGRVQQVLHQHLPGHRCEACLHSVLSQQHREREREQSCTSRSLGSTSPARQLSREEAIVAVALNTVDGGSKAPVALSSTPLHTSFAMLSAVDSLASRRPPFPPESRVHSPRWIPSGQPRTSTTTGKTRSSATSPVDLVAISVPGSNPSHLPQATAARAAYHVVKAVGTSPGHGTQRPTIAKSRRALANRVGAPMLASSSSVNLLQSSLGLPHHARVFADGRDYGLRQTSQQTSKILIHMAPDPVPPALPGDAGQRILHEKLHLQPAENRTQPSPAAHDRGRLVPTQELSALGPRGGGDYRLDQSLAAILDEIDAAVSQKRAETASALGASVGRR